MLQMLSIQISNEEPFKDIPQLYLCNSSLLWSLLKILNGIWSKGREIALQLDNIRTGSCIAARASVPGNICIAIVIVMETTGE